MSTIKSDFWVFSDSKGAGSRKGEDSRWGLLLSLDRVTDDLIKWTDGPIRLTMSLIGEVDRDTDIEDVPWVMDHVRVVSERTKQLFVQAGSDDCQFFPVEVRYKGKPLGLTYWAMHCLHTIDCADQEASYKSITPPLYYISPVIIPEKVPAMISTFRVAHAGSSPIVRDALRRELKRAKITGCMFYRP